MGLECSGVPRQAIDDQLLVDDSLYAAPCPICNCWNANHVAVNIFTDVFSKTPQSNYEPLILF